MRLIGLAGALLVVVALAVAAGVGAFGGAWSPTRGAAQPPSSAELQKLAAYALDAATQDGDAHPTGAFVVATTRRIAEEVAAGDNGEPNTPAYFVVIRGRFTLTDVSVPPGSRAPTGTVLTLTIEPRANQSLDLGAGTRMPNLYAMGQPEPLPLPSG
jgi:hypothetical protein